MLYQVRRGEGVQYRGFLDDLVYLVVCAESIERRGLSCAIVDRHPMHRGQQWRFSTKYLGVLDWDSIRDETILKEDEDRWMKRMAEFLVKPLVPWECVETIGVRSTAAQVRVQQALAELAHRPRTSVEPTWFPR